MKKISEVVGTILKLMAEYAKVGMSTKELDKYGGEILKRFGAKSTYAVELMDGWTLVGNKVGYFTQHEQTILITDSAPIILTASNGLWN